jgi:hypothetical protein
MAKLMGHFLALMSVLCLLFSASYSNAQSAQPTDNIDKISLLLNAQYEIEGKIFTLKDGEYSDLNKKTGEGMYVILQKPDIICDDLTGSGVEGAVVKLAYNTGGMGTFYVIAIMRYGNGTYSQVFHIYAGTNYDHITFSLTKQTGGDRTIFIEVKDMDGKEHTIHCALSKLFF